jgi:ferritin-like metal-binding protein YciE
VPLESPRDLFIHELSDALSAEKIIRAMLKQVVKETKMPAHRDAFAQHLEETEGHIATIEAAFKQLGEKPERLVCHGAEGLKEEHASLKKEKPKGHVLELGLLGGASKTEHYEIASYKGLVQMATDLGETKVAALLQTNLKQELAMATKVESLAKAVGKDAKVAAASAAAK